MRPTTETINPRQAYRPAPYPPPQRPADPGAGAWPPPADPGTGSWDLAGDPGAGAWPPPADPGTGSWDLAAGPGTGAWQRPADPGTGSWDLAAGPATGSWDGTVAWDPAANWDGTVPPGWGAARPSQPRPAPAPQPRPRPPAPPPGPPAARRGMPGQPMARGPAARPAPGYAAPRPGGQVPAARPRGGVPATRSSSVSARRYDSGRHEGGHARQVSSEEAMEATARTAADADAQLLSAFRSAVRTITSSVPALYPRLIFLALGYTAIGPLGAAYAELLPLPYGARLFLLPAVLICILVGFRHKEWGRRALVGWLAGVAATGIYDVLRLSLYKFGYWDDPIPGIGRLMLDNPHAPAIVGYIWRFGGNGAGMGMAFAMLPWRGIRSGIAYGTAVCFGLFGVLYFAPVAQQHFFPLNLKTAIGALAGHWVYGAVLGYLTSVSLPPVRISNLPFVPDPGAIRRGALGWRAPAGGRPAGAIQGARVPVPARREVMGTARTAQGRWTDSTWPPSAPPGPGYQGRSATMRASRPPMPGQAPTRPVPGRGARQAQPRDRAPGGRHIRQPDGRRRSR